ncbi:MAG: hypothetical protein QM703_21795 [Gemmatales bacterium]
MSDQIQLYLIDFALQLPIGFITLLLAILAAHFWTGSGSFPLFRTLLVTIAIALIFAMPSLWGWPTFFSAPISVAALFYLPFWLGAIWFGFRLDVKEAWTIICIHWPLIVGVMLFIYFPIYRSIEREYEEKEKRRKREQNVWVLPPVELDTPLCCLLHDGTHVLIHTVTPANQLA